MTNIKEIPHEFLIGQVIIISITEKYISPFNIKLMIYSH